MNIRIVHFIMKKILFFFIIVSTAISVTAQNPLYITAGTSFNYFMKDGDGVRNHLSESNPGFQLGISYQQYKKDRPGFFAASAQLVTLPVKYYTIYEDAGKETSKQPVYLQLSPSVGLRSAMFKNMGLYGTVGAYVNVLANFEKTFRPLSAGINASAGIDLNDRWQVGGDYLFGFTNLLSEEYGSTNEIYLRSIQLSLRYRVSGKK